jgi:UDP-N-acetylmuramoylalanine--D-glutamate ligase
MQGTAANLLPSLVVGLGKSGLSAVRWLAARGVHVRATDSREQPPGLAAAAAVLPPAELRVGGFDSAALDGMAQVVLSPGLPRSLPLLAEAHRRGLPVVGDVELFAREANAAQVPVVGITGTNGKSTVTTLVGEVAQAAGLSAGVGGNLGEPALDLLAAGRQLYVLELSSYQLESCPSLACTAATVLNVTPDHLDRYATVAEYAQAKAAIFDRCGTAVVNRDDPWCRAMGAGARATVGFALQADAEYRLEARHGEDWLVAPDGPLLPQRELRIPGLHNAANALAAVALADAAGLPRAATLDVLRRFAGLPHRAQWVGERRGVTYIDDSKGTNVGATIAAVAGLPAPLVIIAGGDGKGQDFAPLASAFRGKVRAAVLIGRDREALATALADTCPVLFCKTLPAAVAAAAGCAQPGDRVLLSPACASLDMFDDYAHRGRVFAAAVAELPA